MKLTIKTKIADKLYQLIEENVKNRKPDVIVGEKYLKRWHIIPENPIFNIYYHEIRASDFDRHLHDHPFWWFSFMLRGSYIEHTTKRVNGRSKGYFTFKSPWRLHKLIMNDQDGANTIFITIFKIRKWGFQTEDGWVPNDKYLDKFGIQSGENHNLNPVIVRNSFKRKEKNNENNFILRIGHFLDDGLRTLIN